MLLRLLDQLDVLFLFGSLIAFSLFALYRRKRKDSYVRQMTESGYIEVLTPNGVVFEHRLWAENILGRRLRPFEVVHHINGRPYDNRLENLCVMHERAHDAYHKWYDWIYDQYGNYPRKETQLKKLRESFGGTILAEYQPAEIPKSLSRAVLP